jgi:translation initiation factor IF-3
VIDIVKISRAPLTCSVTNVAIFCAAEREYNLAEVVACIFAPIVQQKHYNCKYAYNTKLRKAEQKENRKNLGLSDTKRAGDMLGTRLREKF